MEVHKHPHHVAHKKNWGEYLLEFFMLFLAVFLGFIAENIRESNVERRREVDYAAELLKELSVDSVACSNKTLARIEKERDCDYLYDYIRDSSLTNLPRRFYTAYTRVFYLINSYTFEPKDGVLNQIRNAGALRFFKDVELQKLIGDLSVTINNVRSRNEQEYQFFASPLKPFLLEHYDFGWINQLRKLDATASSLELLRLYEKSDTTIAAAILSPGTINRVEAANMIMFNKAMLVSTRTLTLSDYVKTSARLMQALRTDYGFERE